MIKVDHKDVILRTFILFVQTAHAVLKYADAHLYKETGLSTIKFIVLRILASNGGTMTPSEIANWTHRERHNITTLIERMEKSELVRTKRNDKDKRFINITITDKGHKFLSTASPVARKIISQVMSLISEGDAIVLEKQLQGMRENAHNSFELVAKRSVI